MTKKRVKDHPRDISHQTQNPADWSKFRNALNDLKQMTKRTKSDFYHSTLSSKRQKEVSNTIFRILHPNPKGIRADPNKLNEH